MCDPIEWKVSVAQTMTVSRKSIVKLKLVWPKVSQVHNWHARGARRSNRDVIVRIQFPCRWRFQLGDKPMHRSDGVYLIYFACIPKCVVFWMTHRQWRRLHNVYLACVHAATVDNHALLYYPHNVKSLKMFHRNNRMTKNKPLLFYHSLAPHIGASTEFDSFTTEHGPCLLSTSVADIEPSWHAIQ